MATMWISIMATFVVRLPLAYILVELSKSEQYPAGKADYLYYSQIAAWFFGTAVSFWMYRREKWKGEKK